MKIQGRKEKEGGGGRIRKSRDEPGWVKERKGMGERNEAKGSEEKWRKRRKEQGGGKGKH